MDRAPIIQSIDKLLTIIGGVEVGAGNPDMANTAEMPNEQCIHEAGFLSRCVLIKTKHTGWIVLQSMQRHDGSRFIAPTFCETKPGAELYASSFHNIVAIMPIEWEE